jgi:hypothetical protein
MRSVLHRACKRGSFAKRGLQPQGRATDKYEFILETLGRQWFLAAESLEEQERWLSFISQVGP